MTGLFKQSDIRRAIHAAEAVGLCVKAVEIDPGGTIRLLTETKAERAAVANDIGDWTDYAGKKALPRA